MPVFFGEKKQNATISDIQGYDMPSHRNFGGTTPQHFYGYYER